MIVGVVRNNEPRVTLTLFGTAGRQEIEFVVDTGFENELAMPSSLLQSVGAQVRGRGFMILADGTARECAICMVQAEGASGVSQFQAMAIEGDPLVGMAFLRDSHLHIDVTEGGEVLIEPL